MNMLANVPGADEQLQFLANIQRLFAESNFTATYKFALLSALADIAIESGADDALPMVITTRQIAEKFILLYWHHVLPYAAGTRGTVPGVLVQNSGEQASVVSAILAFRRVHSATTPQIAQNLPSYRLLVSKVALTVSAQPLNFLQNFGESSNEFIYTRAGIGRIELKAGVAYCLRRFYPLVQQLARANWILHIKRNPRNHPILGQADDLENFLFAASRQSLSAMAVGLKKLDGPKCFYCGRTVADADVDHFIPFSQYPRDLAHNFVLAHPKCNRSKSDTLAASAHLERWLARIERLTDDLSEIGVGAGMPVNLNVTQRVAAWGYTSAIAHGGNAWLAPNQYEHIDRHYERFFMQ